MARINWGVFAARAAQMALGIVTGAALAFQGTAVAHPPPPACSVPVPEDDLPVPVVNPGPADRQSIMDVISMFNWALDEKHIAPLTELLTTDVNYEVCMSGGRAGVFSATNRIDAIGYIDGLFDELSGKGLRARHFHSNTLLHVIDDSTVVGKITLLVTLQPAHRETPEMDYTATINATFTKSNDDWSISRWKKLTDTPTPSEIGGRAR